ncbi:hypothetical protein RBB77_15515 [Tunturibacter psychrotolerans]|uniref:Uncharacterized protein n=1 Tax=Tunturiibacter psychrotolerans TaxID=3069686 RepID=A0AAU7ZLM7_9BACT
MTISFVRFPFSGPVWSLDFVLSGECCYARIYCKRVAKPAPDPAENTLTNSCNKIETAASIHQPAAPTHTASIGIRLVPPSIRSVPATPIATAGMSLSRTFADHRTVIPSNRSSREHEIGKQQKAACSRRPSASGSYNNPTLEKPKLARRF